MPQEIAFMIYVPTFVIKINHNIGKYTMNIYKIYTYTNPMGIFLQDVRGPTLLSFFDQGNVNANWTAHSAFFKGTLKAGFDTSLMSSTDAFWWDSAGRFFFVWASAKRLFASVFYSIYIVLFYFRKYGSKLYIDGSYP